MSIFIAAKSTGGKGDMGGVGIGRCEGVNEGVYVCGAWKLEDEGVEGRSKGGGWRVMWVVEVCVYRACGGGVCEGGGWWWGG